MANTENTTKEAELPNLDSVLHILKHLRAFRRVRSLLQDCDIPVGIAWDDLFDGIKKNYTHSIHAKLITMYQELRIFGRKHVYLFSFDHDPTYISSIQQLKASGENADSFPFIVKQPDPSEYPALVAVKKYGDRLLLVFLSTRTIQRHILFDRDWLKADAPETIVNAEFRVVSTATEPAFDIIAIPLNGKGYIECRIDLFDENTKPTPSDALVELLRAGRAVLDEAGISHSLTGDSIDFAPIMKPIYDNKTDGKIVELAFFCSTHTRRREVLTSKDGCDLREEAYHDAGVKALKLPIDIFRLAVEWSHNDKNEPLENAHLLLPGTISLLKKNRRDSQPALDEIRVVRITGQLEYEFMITRLETYVKTSG